MSYIVTQELGSIPDTMFSPIAVLGLRLVRSEEPSVSVHLDRHGTLDEATLGSIRIPGAPDITRNMSAYYNHINTALCKWLKTHGLVPATRHDTSWRSDYKQKPSERPVRQIGMIVVVRA